MTQDETDVILRGFFNKIVGKPSLEYSDCSQIINQLYDFLTSKEHLVLKTFCGIKYTEIENSLEQHIFLLKKNCSRHDFIVMICLAGLMVEFYPAKLHTIHNHVLKYFLSLEFEIFKKTFNLKDWDRYLIFLQDIKQYFDY